MNLAIVLVHNKTTADNIKQINSLITLLDVVTETIDGEVQFSHYLLRDVPGGYPVSIYQIVPFGVQKPSNINDLKSWNVYYGQGDEDKTGDHPRFFNWGIKRATDNGADIVVSLTDIDSFDLSLITKAIEDVSNDATTLEFVELSTGNVVTKKVLSQVGQLKEDRSFPDAIVDYKSRMTAEGVTYG